MIITGRDNDVVKFVKKLQKKSFRDENGLFVAEGERLVYDASKKGAHIQKLFITNEYKGNNIQADATYTVDEKIMATMSDTKSPQGILAVIKKPEYDIKEICEPVVICDRVMDPGNMGTIIRTADAAGFGAVIALRGSVDIYSPKVIRSTMGSVFSIPVLEGNLEDILGLELLCADLDNSSSIYDFDFRRPFGVVIGNEANGVSPEVMAACHSRIKIPMLGGSESLNAAVSFAVIAYEAVRQRKFC